MQDQITSACETLNRDEQFAALAQVYLELHLPLHLALEAARADLQYLIAGSGAIAEAA
jgi:hypothetical protein